MSNIVNTPNNDFPYPSASNDGADFALGVQEFADAVDEMWLSGTLVGRPSAGIPNRRYYATDAGLFYTDTGSSWTVALNPLSGTFASRPTSGVLGETYYATDTGLWYFYNGSAWQTVMLAGPWTNLTRGTNINTLAGYYAPSARQVGDRVDLRGGMQTTGIISPGATIFTVPFAPASNVGGQITYQGSGGGPAPIEIASGTGIATTLGATLSSGQTFTVDSLSYPVS